MMTILMFKGQAHSVFALEQGPYRNEQKKSIAKMPGNDDPQQLEDLPVCF